MSGPIVRKYGFANFEKIFGERPIEHGLEESDEKKIEGKPLPKVEDPKAEVKKPS